MPRRPNRTLDLIRVDPRRSTRWRYERVRVLLDSRPANKLPGWTRDDRSIREAFFFIKDWERLGQQYRNPRELQERRQEMYTVNPELYLAHDMAFAADSERTRYEVEARILARQTDKEIANEVCGLPGAIDWYERLFFNVRDRLRNRGYIVNRVICPAVIEPNWDNLTLDMTSKFFGYFAGSVILDVILHNYDSAIITPQKGDDTGTFFDKHWGTQYRRRSAEAVNSFEFNKYNVVELFEIHTKLMDMVQKAKSEGGELNVLEEQVQVMLGSFRFSVGSERENALADSPLKPYTGHAGELRASEMLQIVNGKVPESTANISTLKLPERSVTRNEQPAEQGSRD